MKLIYEGVDITPSIAINHCEHETYAEGRADQLVLRFCDAKNNWDNWRPKRGDRVQFIDEAADTGKLFVTSLAPENGLYTLRAMSMPLSGETVNSRAWENVRLLQVANDIAKKHGLTLRTYNVVDQIYQYVEQRRLTDFAFLSARCALEGYALTIFDGQLIIYDEHKTESAPPSGEIKVGQDGRFTYTDNSARTYGAAEIQSGRFRGSFTDPTAPADRIFRPTELIECSTDAEAQRFARGLLRQVNKNGMTGSFRRKLTQGVAAGSVITLRTDKAPSWDGTIFITRTRSDFVRGETKIFFRKPLGGY